MKKRIIVRTLFILLIVLVANVFPKTGLAAPEAVRGGVSNIPDNTGVKLHDIFKTPDSGSNSFIESGENYDTVVITPRVNNQTGAIWSTDNNRMDLSEDFSGEMYLNFGTKGKDAADGIAFVMHNDDRATNTIQAAGKGQELGVWGAYDEKDSLYGEFKNYPSPLHLHHAIQNSFAIEFDTFRNVNWDYEISPSHNHHIGWGYPANTVTYSDTWYSAPLTPFVSAYRHMALNGPTTSYWWPSPEARGVIMYQDDGQRQVYLSMGHWYKLTLEWKAASKELTYTFANERPVTVNLDTTVFGTNEVYWGFTGKTGSSASLNRVVFSKVPLSLYATASETITNSEDETISEQTAKVGDELTHTIEVEYQSGNLPWTNLQLEKELSEHLSYVPGSLEIDGQAVNDDESNWSGHSLRLPLGKILSSPGEKIQVKFKVITNEVVSDTSITSINTITGLRGTGVGHGDYDISTDLQQFVLKAGQAPEILSLSLTGSSEVTDLDEVSFSGEWQDKDHTDSLTFYYTIDNDSTTKTAFLESVASTGGQAEFGGCIEAGVLSPGVHSIQVFAVDSYGLESNKAEINAINVSGSVVIQEITDANFGTIRIPDNNQTFQRTNGAFRIKMKDTRLSGTKTQLVAKLTGEIPKIVPGSDYQPLIFKDGEVTHALNEQDQPILSNLEPGFGTKNQSWENDEGLLLQIPPSAKKANYSWTIHWTAEQVPDP